MLRCDGAAPHLHRLVQSHKGQRHAAEVQAESLLEAVVLAVRVLKADPRIDSVGTATVFDIEVREPATTHAVSMCSFNASSKGGATSPNEASKKAKLKNLLISP